MSILSRNVNFIKPFLHKLKVYRDKLVSIHTALNKTTESSMYNTWKSTDRNLYSMFFGWLLENVVMIGSLITITLSVLFNYDKGYYTFLMPLLFGCLYWFIIDTIKRISNAIRSKE